jgi:hypothetical protein
VELDVLTQNSFAVVFSPERSEENRRLGQCRSIPGCVNEYLKPDGEIFHNFLPFQHIWHSVKILREAYSRRSLPRRFSLEHGSKDGKEELNQEDAVEFMKSRGFFEG